MHRQAEDPGGTRFADGKVAFPVLQISVCRLKVKRQRIINRCWYVVFFETPLECGTVVFIKRQNGVLRLNTFAAFRHGRQGQLPAGFCQQVAVPCRHGLPQVHLFGKDIEFGEQNGRLEGIQPSVDADAHVVVFVPAFAVHPKGPHFLGQGFIVRGAHAAVTITSQWLGREKGGATDIPLATCPLALVFGSKGLGRILDDKNQLGTFVNSGLDLSG